MLNFSPLFLLIIITFFSVQSTQAEVYRWKDKDGKIHFSDKPHADAKQLDIKAPKPSGIGISDQQVQRQKELLNTFQEKRETQQKQAKKDKKKKAAIDNYCKKLRNRLRNYEEVDYLFTRDGTGTRQDLNDQQKKDEEQKLRALIAERC